MLRAGLFIFLLAQPMLLQAEVAAADKLASETAVNPANIERQRGYQQQFFPGWTERRRAAKEIIPPPPPGPYASKALSGFSAETQAVNRDLNKPAKSFNASNVPMETFSPDRSWPEQQSNYGSNNRWTPESRYYYPMPQFKNKPYPSAISKLPSNENYGYRSAPAMNFPGMNTSGSRWLPSMNTNSGRVNSMMPYSTQPNYGAGYYKPVNRMPYPVVGNQ